MFACYSFFIALIFPALIDGGTENALKVEDTLTIGDYYCFYFFQASINKLKVTEPWLSFQHLLGVSHLWCIPNCSYMQKFCINVLCFKYVLYGSVYGNASAWGGSLSDLWCFCRPMREHAWNFVETSQKSRAERLHVSLLVHWSIAVLLFVHNCRADPGHSVTDSRAKPPSAVT